MKPSRAFIAANLVCFAALIFLFGGDVVDYVRAKTAPVAAMLELPPLWFAAPVVLASLALLAVVVGALRRGQDDSFKGYRLLPILLVVALFVRFLVLGESAIHISSANLSAITLHGLSAELSQLSTAESVPTDPNVVASVVEKAGPPPYLVRGERPARFGLQVRTGCEGPIGEAAGVEAGTILYCVAKDRAVGWLTLVGLPAEETFGSPAVFSMGGNVQVTTVFRPGDLELAAEMPELGDPEIPESPELDGSVPPSAEGSADAAVASPQSDQTSDAGR